MPTLPPSPDLDQLKKQARELLRAFRVGDPEAERRVRAQLPHRTIAAGEALRLTQTLLVLAREYGFASWPKLKAAITTIRQERHDAAPPPDGRLLRREARRHFIAEQTAQMLGFARSGEVETLAASFNIPRRDIQAIRALLVSRDDPDYTLLIDRLIAGLRHDSPKVRYRCAGALDHFGDARCIAPLRALVADPVPRVRRMALHALSCEACKLAPFHDDADLVGLLTDYALHDLSINVRRHATYGLASRRDDPRAAAVLEQLRGNVADPTLGRYLRRIAGYPTSRAASPGE
jgi:hypothetical protein